MLFEWGKSLDWFPSYSILKVVEAMLMYSEGNISPAFIKLMEIPCFRRRLVVPDIEAASRGNNGCATLTYLFNTVINTFLA